MAWILLLYCFYKLIASDMMSLTMFDTLHRFWFFKVLAPLCESLDYNYFSTQDNFYSKIKSVHLLVSTWHKTKIGNWFLSDRQSFYIHF